MPRQTSRINNQSEPMEPCPRHEGLFPPTPLPTLPPAPRPSLLTTPPSSPELSNPPSPLPGTLPEPDSFLQSWSLSSPTLPPRASSEAIKQFLVEPRALPDVPHHGLNRSPALYEAIRALPPMRTLVRQARELWFELANNYENAIPADLSEALKSHMGLLEQVQLLSLFDEDQSPDSEELPVYSRHLQPGERRVSPPSYGSWTHDAIMDLNEYVAIRDWQAAELLDNITELKRRSTIGRDGVQAAREVARNSNQGREREHMRVAERNRRTREGRRREDIADIKRRTAQLARTVEGLRQQLADHRLEREGSLEASEPATGSGDHSRHFVGGLSAMAQEEEDQLKNAMIDGWYEHLFGLDYVQSTESSGRRFGVVCRERGYRTLCFVSWEGNGGGVWAQGVLSPYA